MDEEITLDLHTIKLLEGSICADIEEESAQMLQMNNLSLNLVVLPIQTLHEPHLGVSYELRIWEQHALLVISKVKTNNQQIFEEKTHSLKEKEEITA